MPEVNWKFCSSFQRYEQILSLTTVLLYKISCPVSLVICLHCVFVSFLLYNVINVLLVYMRLRDKHGHMRTGMREQFFFYGCRTGWVVSPLPYPSLPLEVDPLKPSQEVQKVPYAPRAGFGAEPQLKLNLVHFNFKI